MRTLSRAFHHDSELIGSGFICREVTRHTDLAVHLSIANAGISKSLQTVPWPVLPTAPPSLSMSRGSALRRTAGVDPSARKTCALERSTSASTSCRAGNDSYHPAAKLRDCPASGGLRVAAIISHRESAP